MKKRRKSAKEETITLGSTNVFAGLGLPNPEQELLKAELTLQIYRIIKQRNLMEDTGSGKYRWADGKISRAAMFHAARPGECGRKRALTRDCRPGLAKTKFAEIAGGLSFPMCEACKWRC